MKRLLLIISAVFILVVVLIYFNLDSMVESQFRHLVMGKQRGGYNMSFSGLDVRLFEGTVLMNNFSMRPSDNMDSSTARIYLHVDSAAMIGLSLLKLYRGTIDMDTLLFRHPELEVYWYPEIPLQQDTVSKASPAMNRIQRMVIQQFQIDEAQAHLYQVGKDTSLTATMKSFSFEVGEATFTTDAGIDSLIISNFRILAKKMDVPDLNNNRIHLGSFEFNYPARTLEMRNIQLLPHDDIPAFDRKNNHRKTRAQATLAEFTVKGVDWREVVSGRYIFSKMEINGADMDFYNNPDLPFPKDKKFYFLQTSIYEIPAPFHIDTFKVVDSRIQYSNPGVEGESRAEIFFNEINGSVYTISNNPDYMDSTMKVHLTLRPNGTGLLKLDASFPYGRTDDPFEIRIDMKSASLPAFNSVIEPETRLHINNGELDYLITTVKGNKYRSNTELEMLYHDVNVSVYKYDQENKSKRKRKLISGLANVLVLHDKRSGPESRYGHTRMRRGKETPFIKFLWQSVAEGMKEAFLSKGILSKAPRKDRL